MKISLLYTFFASLLGSCSHAMDKHQEIPTITVPLIQAIKRNDAGIVPLLTSSANLTETDEFGMTALHWATLKGNEVIIEELLNAKANPNTCIKNTRNVETDVKLNCIRHALKMLYCSNSTTTTATEGLTPLHIAAILGNDALSDSESVRSGLAIVQILLKHGAMVNAQTHRGHTSLLYAAYCGNAQIVAALLEAGAHPNVTDTFDKMSPLNFAATTTKCTSSFEQAALHLSGDGTIAELLLAADANPYNANKIGLTPFSQAFFPGYNTIVETFIHNGVNPNTSCPMGELPLYMISGNASDTIQLLLKAGKTLTEEERDQIAEKHFSHRQLLYFLVKGMTQEFSKALAHYRERCLNLVEYTKNNNELTDALLVAYGQEYNNEAEALYHVLTTKFIDIRPFLIKALQAAVARGSNIITNLILDKLAATKEPATHDELRELLKIAVKNALCEIIEVLLIRGAPTESAEAFINSIRRVHRDHEVEHYYQELLTRWSIQHLLTTPEKQSYFSLLPRDVLVYLVNRFVNTAMSAHQQPSAAYIELLAQNFFTTFI